MSAEDDQTAQRRAEVLRLTYADGLGIRAIARRLKMARKTVRGMLDGDRARKYDKPPLPRARLLGPFEAPIRQMLGDTPELQAPAVLERLRALGYRGGITIVRDRLRALRPHVEREAFLTLDFPVGEAAQVDWADFGFALPGCPRRVSAFVMVLCYSRYLYLEFTLSQAMGAFLRCMEPGPALLRRQHQGRHLRQHEDGGAVAHADRHRLQPPLPRVRPRPPVRGGGLQRTPRQREGNRGAPHRLHPRALLAGLPSRGSAGPQRQGRRLAGHFANNRVHEVTGKVPALVFQHEESRVLRADRRRLLQHRRRRHHDGEQDLPRHASTATATRCRRTWSDQTVLVRADDHAVSVFLGPKMVATHARCWDTNKDIEDPAHAAVVLARKPRAKAGDLPPMLVGLGQPGVAVPQDPGRRQPVHQARDCAPDLPRRALRRVGDRRRRWTR